MNTAQKVFHSGGDHENCYLFSRPSAEEKRWADRPIMSVGISAEIRTLRKQWNGLQQNKSTKTRGEHMKQKHYIVGLYYRKSQEDERQGESISIENQRMILRKYAEDHGFEIHDEYIDDGVSGTTFQRPEVQRLLDDAKTGVINTRHRNSKNLNGSESRLNRTGISRVR